MPAKPLKMSVLVVLGTLVLVVASLYWARAVLMPVALAMLLTFLLSPCDKALRRWGLSRVASVLLLAVLAFSLIGVMGWAISVQARGFANDLPAYQQNIKKRVADMQMGKGTPLDNVRKTIEGLIGDVNTSGPSTEPGAVPLLVTVQAKGIGSSVWQLVLPSLEYAFQILFVAMLVVFMLLEREELRNRVIRLLGYGRLSLTTETLDEAGKRVSRYLFTQFIVNACLGVAIWVGLLLLGVPYALLWGCLVVLLRFIPFVGIWIAALLAFAVCLAASSNWWQPVSVLVLFAVLEPVVGMIIEPMLFSQNAGTSKLALLIATSFWTWLWGPIGLLLATPLTACLAVIAKNVPQLQFVSVLFGDEPMMQASVTYYQRLLALDVDKAEAIVEEHLHANPVEHVFEELLVPALHYAKRDRQLGLLTAEEQAAIYNSIRQMVERIGLPSTRLQPPTNAANDDASTVIKVRIVAWPAHDEGDAIALLMLQQLLDPARFDMEIAPPGQRLSEILGELERKTPAVFCMGLIPPGGLSACRHLCKFMRGRLPEMNIVAGYWGLPEKSHDDCEVLMKAGATHCAATLIETREQIDRAVHPQVKVQLAPAA